MTSPTRFSEELRLATGKDWDDIINHKFATELANGTISDQVLKRYLIQDYRFLDSFVQLLASIIAKARSLEDRLPLCRFLGIVTGKEFTYFTRSFEKLGVSDQERDETPNAECTINFLNQMENAAHKGTLSEMLAVITVCEWSYLSWAQRVDATTIREGGRFECYEWVDLHFGEYFESVVEHFRMMLDKEGELLKDDEAGKELCRTKFHETVKLETDFFDNAYDCEP